MTTRKCRTGRHSINGPADLRPSGACIHCNREGQKRYRQRLQDARRIVKELEESGASPWSKGVDAIEKFSERNKDTQ
ncbi:hypothetical protein PBI_LESEDI_66 [Mycobacterium phage Lesedi]|uniref:Uncharacterized protein n=1 Tax=Mycobacterium phage Lesedi TaxID=2922211 RepID=G1D3L2_9CAUD|nr:hypothetical protein FGG26_gp66 [Mycobacterium phage Lesedi]AEK09362.1 hypothetical protein PBI_LESEDI_66 [Mycobacterium phage Lesedi]